MTDWLFTWKARLIGAILLLSALVVAVHFRAEAQLGNITSIVGLVVSVLGFIVTVWTVIDARQQIKDAGDRAEKAIMQASVEARRTVRRIAAQLQMTDCAVLRSWLEDLRQAARDGSWERAVYRCQESQTVAFRLADDPILTGEEQSTLRSSADDLRLIRTFIEKHGLAGQEGRLQDSHMRKLDKVLDLLARIQARLHHESFRATETPSES